MGILGDKQMQLWEIYKRPTTKSHWTIESSYLIRVNESYPDHDINDINYGKNMVINY